MSENSRCPLCGGESMFFWKHEVTTNKCKSVVIELRGCRPCQVGFNKWEEWEAYVGKFPLAMRIKSGDLAHVDGYGRIYEVQSIDFSKTPILLNTGHSSSLEVPVSKIECFVQKGGIK